MTGEQIQDMIYDWLNEHYPEGPLWIEPEFDAYENVPIEIKMVSAFDALEYNISNGGWSQVLWNCYGTWRKLIDIAREGYTLIDAQEQTQALDALYALCERDEKECETGLATEDGSMESFTEFTSRSCVVDGDDWEELFWSDSGVYEKRLAWLQANESRVRKALGRIDA